MKKTGHIQEWPPGAESLFMLCQIRLIEVLLLNGSVVIQSLRPKYRPISSALREFVYDCN